MTQSWDEFAGDDRIDSRDLIEAADELVGDLENPDAELFAELNSEQRHWFNAVVALQHEVGSEWTYGAELIREDQFTDYARELAEDIGAVASDAQWPAYCIDWERAARELAMDYSLVTFLGYDYYVRS